MGKFDVVVVGGGPGGYPAAIRAAQKGLKVACVEKNKLGGTCLNVGCIPSKALLNTTAKLAEAKTHFKKLGLTGGDKVAVNWKDTQKNKDNVVKTLVGGIEFLFKKNKVMLIKGEGFFNEEGVISVKKPNGEVEALDTKNVILATGSLPSDVPGGQVKVDENKVVTSTGALSLPNIPKKMIVIGGGVIGVELGTVYNRMGTKVEVVEYMNKICPSLDDEIGKSFLKMMQKDGLKFHLSTKVKSTKTSENGVEVTVEKDGKETIMTADVVLVAVGRRPVTDPLNLNNANITADRLKRIPVDSFLAGKSKGTNIYAIGDIIPGPMLAHKAEEDGIACADGIATGKFHVPNNDHCPQVIYTEPEVAGVGLTEQELKKQGIKYKVAKFPNAANSRSRVIGSTGGMVKIMFDPSNHKILGAFVVGTAAGELIHELSLIMSSDLSLKNISASTFAHPTLSEAVKEAAMIAVDGKAIHA